jgi:phospholipid/cholesterol/gamma-HCH transport system substrate-binding protein
MATDPERLTMARTPYSMVEKLTGLVLAALFLAVMGAAAIVGAGRGLFKGYTSYFTVFSQGYGIDVGEEVRYFGIEVGNVTEVELMDNNKIRMRLRIADDYAGKILGDCLAAVKSATIIGSEYIDITPGTDLARPIPEGGQIPSEDSHTLSEFVDALKQDFPKKLAQVDELIADVISTADRLQDNEGPLFATLGNFRQVSAMVARGEGSLGAMLSREETYDEIHAAVQDIRRATESVRDAAASIAEAAAGLERDLPGITGRAGQILTDVQKGTQSLPEVARGAREGLRDVHQILDSAKRNFLIRGNLTGDPPPEGVDVPLRGR